MCTYNLGKSMWGGKREGAGRKPVEPEMKKVQLGLKLPVWLLNWMDDQPESRAVLIENALREKHQIAPPVKDEGALPGPKAVRAE